MEAAPQDDGPHDATPEFFTTPGAPDRDNEDAAVVAPGVAVVVDGAGVAQRYRAGCRHSVTWFSHRLAAALAERLTDRHLGARTALASAINEVAGQHGPGCDLGAGSPSATIAAFRTTGDHLEYLVQCDAAIGVLHVDGRTTLVSDGLIDRVGLSAARLRARLQAEGLDPDRVSRQVNDHIEGLRNHPDGFWIAQHDPAVARHAIVDCLPRDQVQAVMACSDGITRALDRLGLHTRDSLVRAMATEPATGLVDAIRRAEADGTTRPGKLHDDATLAVLPLV